MGNFKSLVKPSINLEELRSINMADRVLKTNTKGLKDSLELAKKVLDDIEYKDLSASLENLFGANSYNDMTLSDIARICVYVSTFYYQLVIDSLCLTVMIPSQSLKVLDDNTVMVVGFEYHATEKTTDKLRELLDLCKKEIIVRLCLNHSLQGKALLEIDT